MEAEELDVALEELENRLERLRALYEQYFLGIEKLEPQIPRKDVDRRIYVLRREKIRNTGKRFKLQTLISRYNTFQQYWQRVCREIENGTYKRHLARAEKLIGPSELLTTAARRRFGKERSQRSDPPLENGAPAGSASSAPPSAGGAPALAPSSVPVANAGSAPAPPARPDGPRRTPTLRGLSTPPPPGSEVPVSLRPPPPAPAPAESVSSLPPRGADFPTVPRPLAPPVPTVPRPAPPSARLMQSSTPPTQPGPEAPLRPVRRPSSKPAASFESLELDMDFMGDWDPLTVTGRARPRELTRPAGAEPARPNQAPAKGDAEPARRLAPPAKPGGSEHAAPPAAAQPPRFPAEPNTAARRAAPLNRPAPAAPAPAPAPAAPAPAAPAPAAPAPAAPAPAAPAPAPAPKPTAPHKHTPAERGEKAASPAQSAHHGSSAASSALNETRLRDIHQRLLDAAKQTGQPAVSFDGLSKSLRATEAKLRAQHGSHRRVEFEVVVKDGKTIVKPTVR